MIIAGFSTLFPWFNGMFSSIGLFKQVKCPEEPCHLPHCIFNHELPRQGHPSIQSHAVLESGLIASASRNEVLDEQDRARKRRRVDADGSNEYRHAFVPDEATSSPTPEIPEDALHYLEDASLNGVLVSKSLQGNSASREVSPPLRRKPANLSVSHTTNSQNNRGISRADSLKALTKPTPVESLNPRMLHNPPASHAIRMKLVSILHEQMARLNEEVQKCDDASKAELELSSQELVRRVLAEEEKIAIESPSVYNNIVKLRIVSLKKMKLVDWKKERLKHIAAEVPKIAPSIPKAPSHSVDTGLSPTEEIALLPRLLAKQEGLVKFGYVSAQPSEKDILDAKKGVEASQGWEQCDRCRTRFQAFQGRRVEDGALTTGGKCVYHYAKPLRPTKEKAGTGHKDPIYPCCNQSISTSVGCTTADSHVYKTSDPKRLALILPFMTTPYETGMKTNTAVCFDCEMGYTTFGMELIRLTATSWPSGTDLLDILVRPLGEILDLNSRFSGVWPSHFSDALPYEGHVKQKNKSAERDADPVAEPPLRIVESPMVAREELLKHLTPKTALIGHALENDLNSVRLIHPSIIDTVLLYPHPRGLPIRFGLKMLVKKHLDRDIQMGGAQGHDSREDARAAGDLVRLKVAATWKTMKSEGWTVENGTFNPPLHSASA